MTAEAPKRGRGRPVTTDPDAVGLTALRLFYERGIDQVTMDDVALEAGISRSNLFRIFPSKAAVIWGGTQNFNEVLISELKANPEGSIVTVLHRAWVNAMHVVDGSLETTRLRLKLIASSPEVYGWGQAQLEESRKILELAASRSPEGNPLRARMLSSALLSASMAVLTWWAQSDDSRTPSQVLDESFSDFERIFESASSK